MSVNIQKSLDITPFKKLSLAIFIGNTSMWTAFMTTVLQLALKLVAIDPLSYTNHYGLITSIGALVALVANPFGGFISDRTRTKFGKRRTWILWGSVVGSLLILLMGYAQSFWQVGTLFVLLQLNYNFVIASFTALIPDQCPPDKRGTLSGINGMTIVLGILIGNIIVHFIWNQSSLICYTILSFIGFIGGIISVSIIKDTAAIDSKYDLNNPKQSIYPSFKRYPNFTWALIMKFLFSFGTGGASYVSIMMIDRIHLSSKYIASVFSLIIIVVSILSAVTTYMGGILSDKLKKQKIFMYVAIMTAMGGTFVYGLADNIVTVIIAMIVINMAGGVFNAVDSALVVRVLPPDSDNGKNFGIMNVANSLPQSIVPAIAPLLLSTGAKIGINKWAFFYFVLGFFVLLSIGFLKPIPEVDPEKS